MRLTQDCGHKEAAGVRQPEDILHVEDLTFSFDTYAGEVQAVRGIDFFVRKGETLGIVGESGCGKSVTAKTITKINPMPPGRLKGGRVVFNGRDITDYTNKQMRAIRSKDIRMIFQDPMTSLNPTMKVGKQITEGILKSEKMPASHARKKAIEMLELVGLPNPDIRFTQYPHEYSGGMRQRAMVALAMAVNPKLLIADEPTTALDVTTQAQVLKLMKKIQREFDTAIIMITHDLGVIANIATRVAVMYAGKIVEGGLVDDIFTQPAHPYTWGLLESIPHVQLKKKEVLKPITGTPPDLFAPPPGCPFAPRCRYAMKICQHAYPQKTQLSENQYVFCWLLHENAPKVENPFRKKKES